MSATESVSTATSKEDDSEMHKRKFDLEDDDEKHSSEGANTLDNMPKRTKMNLLHIMILCSKPWILVQTFFLF